MLMIKKWQWQLSVVVQDLYQNRSIKRDYLKLRENFFKFFFNLAGTIIQKLH
jgi:hypothetical protein